MKLKTLKIIKIQLINEDKIEALITLPLTKEYSKIIRKWIKGEEGEHE